MANQWAIAIGINTYRAFQSLNYAQQDAEALCRHLIDSGITAPENCLLLTPASALHRGHSTFPERETIAQWLKGLVTGGMGPDDSLILFFSGYGVHANGEDYLMPVDGDPADAAATGIAVKSIYRLLSQVPSGKVLIALDMNRNAGSLGEPAGAFSARIAQQANQQYPEMATLLSCEPPEQFARESAGLRHGFFTAGILDVLRSRQREQPGEILDFKRFGTQLSDRMAELCEHYWRPVQTPVVIGRYSIPLGQTAASALVSDGGTEKALGIDANGVGVDSANNGSVDSWDWGNAIAVGGNASNSPQSRPPANGSSPSITSPTENILTPLDISRPTDVSEGFGDDFANTWAWSLNGEGQTDATNDGSANGNSGQGGAITDSAASSAGEYDPDLDPYAAAWEEDFGDTVPFDANSDVVLNAQAQLERQEADLTSDSTSTLEGGPNSGQSGGQDIPAQGIALEPEPVQGGRPGHGGDGTDWHWADLSVAAATEDGPSLGLGNGEQNPPVDLGETSFGEAGLDEAGLDEAASIFEYPDRISPNGFPEPGPQASANSGMNGAAAGLAGAGLVVASRPGIGQDSSQGNGSGSATSPLNPTQTILEPLEPEDPNWNWIGSETAIDVEPEDGLHSGLNGGSNGHPGNSYGNSYGRPPGNLPDYDEKIHAAATYEDVEADWPENALDLDDDPEGLPIVELESEEFSPFLEQQAVESEGRPAWLSLRLIGALGLTSLIALGLLGFFRGHQGEGILPRLQSKFNLPSNFGLPGSWPGQASEETEAGQNATGDGPQSGEVGNSANPDSGGGKAAASQNRSGGTAPTGGDRTTTRPNPELSQPTQTNTAQTTNNPQTNTAQTNNPQTNTAQTNTAQDTDPRNSTQSSAPEFSNRDSRQGGLLSNAQQRIQADQASSFNRAIDTARKVPPGDPDYELARQSMNQWSQEVLALSQQRAKAGEYSKAITTARLVPSDLEGFSEAQRSINQWQIPAQLEHAKAITRPDSASSYNRAISIARNVPEGSKSHPQAQKLMQSWGNNIFEMAQRRANQKQWGLAIAAAELVPPDMPAYGAAQSAIADWQAQLSKPK